MAPLQGRQERCWRVGEACPLPPQEAEPVVESLGHVGRAERADPARGELERQRQPVEAEADPCHVRGIGLVELEARRRGGGALDEQPHGLVAEELVRPEHQRPGRGCRARAPGRRPRPATWSGSRLVVTIVRSGAARSSVVGERGDGGEQVLAVVEQSRSCTRGARKSTTASTGS